MIRLAWASARASWFLLLVVALVSAAVTGVAAVTVGDARNGAVQHARTVVADAAPDDAGLVIEGRGGEAKKQDAAVRAAVADALPDDGVIVAALTRTDVRPVKAKGEKADAEPVKAVLEAPANHDGRTLVDGQWPQSAQEATLHAAAAQRLGVSVGGEVTVESPEGDRALKVVGIWQPADAGAGQWSGSPANAQGQVEDEVGALVVDPETVQAVTADPYQRWTLTPEVETLSAGDLRTWSDGTAEVTRQLDDQSSLFPRGLVTSGGLGALTEAAARQASITSALGSVPLLALSLVGVLGLTQVLGLLALFRRPQGVLLTARGRSMRQAAATGIAEGAAVAAVGSLVGGLAAWAWLAPRSVVNVTWPVILTCLGMFALVVVVVAVVCIAEARYLARMRTPAASGRGRRSVGIAVLVLVAAVTALALWRLDRPGALLLGSGTDTMVDPLAAAGPALALGLTGLVAVALAAPVAFAWASLAQRGKALPGTLAARHVSRGLSAYRVLVVLVVLCTGVTVLASLFDGTSRAQSRMGDELTVGADVVASGLGSDGVPLAEALKAAAPTGTAVPVSREETRIDDDTAALVALPAAQVPNVVRGLTDTDATTLQQGMNPEPDATPTGWVIPDGAKRLTLSVRAGTTVDDETKPSGSGPRPKDVMDRNAPLTVAVTVQDGTFTTTASAPSEAPSKHVLGKDADNAGQASTVTVDLPAGTNRRVVGIEVEGESASVPLVHTLSVTKAEADGQAIETGGTWQGRDPATSTSSEGPLQITLTAQEVAAGLPATAHVAPTPTNPAVPVVVSRSLADRLSLTPGDTVTLPTSGTEVEASVSGVIDGAPSVGSGPALFADLEYLTQARQAFAVRPAQPTSLWAASDDPAATTEALRGLGPSVEVASLDADREDPAGRAREVLWLAAAGSALLAIVVAGAVTAAVGSQRRPTVAVLRAVGVPGGVQARSRVLELLAITAIAVPVGALGGWLVSLTSVPPLVATLLPEQLAGLSVPLTATFTPAALLLAGLLVGIAAVGLATALRVNAQAKDGEYREETR